LVERTASIAASKGKNGEGAKSAVGEGESRREKCLTVVTIANV
jgi:hypothetical protein